MSKKVSKMLLISMLLITMVFVFLTKNLIKGQISYDKVSIQNQLEEQLKTMIVENYSQYYKNIGVSLTPKDVTIKDGIATAIFDTEIDLTLNAKKVEDLPFMKGMLNYLNSKKLIASEAQLEAANKLINDWNSELKDYIGKPEPTANATYKIIANVENDNSVEKGSVNLYISEPSLTSKGDDFYPISLPMLETPEKLEKAGEEIMEETFKKVGSSPLANKTNETKYTYNRLDARDYANSWTSSDAPWNGDCYMDSTDWNNDDYPWYDNAYCNDCADYVSQALHAGGIPIDPGQWDRLNDKNGTYHDAWTYVPSLKEYMMDKGHWTTSNFTQANAGNVIVIAPDSHTMVIVLNDTVTRKFSAHTNDRKQYIYYDYSGWEYYTVQ